VAAPAPELRVFITGASSGIGAALAAHYARKGAALGLLARRLDALQALAARLGAPAACYRADVTDAQAVRAAAVDFIGRFGPPDIVVANAGVSAGTLIDHAEDLAALNGKERAAARVPGAGALPAIEDAPGAYVRVRTGAEKPEPLPAVDGEKEPLR